MSTFRNALRVAARHPIYLIAYLATLSVMGVLVGRLVADQSAGSAGAYEPVRASVAVVDEDGSEVSAAFRAWADETFDAIDSSRGEDVQDDLARGAVDCALVLPRGFGDDLMAAARAGEELPSLQVAYGTDVQAGALAASRASQWVSLAGRAAALEPEADESRVAALAGRASGEGAEVSTAAEAGSGSAEGATTYFNFSAYPIMSAVVVVVGLVLSAFGESEVARRAGCSPISPTRRDASLLAACLVLTLVVWAWTGALGLVAFADELASVSPARVAAVLGCELAVSLTPLALAYLFSRLGLREQGLNAAGNIGGMVLTFLGGAWVPLSLMGPEVQAVAKFVPTYWSCDAVTTLLGAGALSSADVARVGADVAVAALFAAAIASAGLAISRVRRA